MMKITYVKTTDLIPAPFNPADRTDPKVIQDLKRSIERFGILSPLQVSQDLKVADGNRRLKCALELGIETVPVIKTNLSVESTWSELNSNTRPIASGAWAKAYAGGLDEKFIPVQYRNKILELKRILREDFVPVITTKSPRIIEIAKRVAKYIEIEVTDESIRTIVLWMHKHNSQYAARRAMADFIDPEYLLYAITEDKPINRKWSVE